MPVWTVSSGRVSYAEILACSHSQLGLARLRLRRAGRSFHHSLRRHQQQQRLRCSSDCSERSFFRSGRVTVRAARAQLGAVQCPRSDTNVYDGEVHLRCRPGACVLQVRLPGND